MRELHEFAEVKAAWLNQPEIEIAVDVEGLRRRQSLELSATTRSEIIGSIGAALFFAAIVAWRFPSERDRLVRLGCAGLFAWAAVTLFWFRHAVRAPRADAFARTGLEHYRAELERRRDHLRSAWIWHGPLLLACSLAVAALGGRVSSGKLFDALPVLFLLVAWVVVGINRRRRQAAELQIEIDQISSV